MTEPIERYCDPIERKALDFIGLNLPHRQRMGAILKANTGMSKREAAAVSAHVLLAELPVPVSFGLGWGERRLGMGEVELEVHRNALACVILLTLERNRLDFTVDEMADYGERTIGKTLAALDQLSRYDQVIWISHQRSPGRKGLSDYFRHFILQPAPSLLRPMAPFQVSRTHPGPR